ncbi:precorrin-8X methylmutase [Faecalibacterium sp. 9]|uniref:precorrin-8X methylmutase n=1 Tax=Faecalibacterium sp. 9 TaxID=3402018 RepID=UPI003AAAB78E
MTPQHHLPADIERTSISIITRELDELGLTPPPETAAVVKRVIHTTADFDYAKNLRFTPGAVQAAVRALQRGAVIVTDTNMALAGISRPGLAKLGCEAVCYMADPAVAEAAKQAGTTRAVAAMHRAAREHPGAILAVGNAPTALLTIAEEIEAGLRPALVIGVPVGFVNVVESKETLFAVCEQHGVPAIAAMGRKGGSNVAAAICNALVYSAAEMLDPSARGWKG